MHHARIQREETSQDSFLDVVANVVGVLIILVMLVGMQASRHVFHAQHRQAVDSTPSETVAVADSQAQQDLEQMQAELQRAMLAARDSQRSILELATQVSRISHEAQAYDRQRVELAMHRSVMQEEIERRRQLLDSEHQQEFDVQQELLQSQIKLEALTQEQLALASAPEEVEEIECLPTPLAKEVDVPSIHLRLRKGLVSVVPVEALQEELRSHTHEIIRRLQLNSKVVETVGPIEGYRARAVFIKRARRLLGGPTVGQREENVLETYTEFLPNADDIGQNVEQALLPGSALLEFLHSHRRDSPPVDVWLYTDSFNEFRTLKKSLWEMGFSVAIRPMQLSDTIGASPYGTKSAAQ